MHFHINVEYVSSFVISLSVCTAILYVDPVIKLGLNYLCSYHFPICRSSAAATMSHLGTAHSHCPQHVRQDKPIKHRFNYSVDRKLRLFPLPCLCCGPDHMHYLTLYDSSVYSPFTYYSNVLFHSIKGG